MCEGCLVPKLRFPEFTDEWKEYKINDLFEFFPTNSFSRDKLNYEEGEVQNIHYGDIHTTFPDILDYNINVIPFINNDVDLSKIKESSYCINGDLIIADASENYADIGKSTEIINIPENKKVVAGLHTILARNKNNSLVKGFKGYLFLNKKLRLKIKIIANGISVLGINKSNLGNLEVKIPSKDEQEKIANFLSSVDKKTDLLKQKLNQTKHFKKYLLENIFSQKLRFECFDEEWKSGRIGDYCEVFGRIGFRGYTVSDLVSCGEGALTIGGKHISPDHMLDLSNPEYLSWNKYEESPEIKVFNGDVLLVKTASVGKVCFVEGLNEAATINPQLVVFKNIKLNNKYFYYYLTSKNFQKDLYKIKSTTGIPTITQKELMNLNIITPPIEEQEIIASFFTQLDKKNYFTLFTN